MAAPGMRRSAVTTPGLRSRPARLVDAVQCGSRSHSRLGEASAAMDVNGTFVVSGGSHTACAEGTTQLPVDAVA